MRTEFDTERWQRFWSSWEHVIEQVPEAKQDALKAMGEAVLAELRSQIDQQGVNDARGRVKRWQEYRVGSGGGYVAVSPVADEVHVTKSGEKTSAKDVSRYLDRGHGVRGPSGRNKRYRPRFQHARLYVPGHLFYSYTRDKAGRIAAHAAEKNVLVPLENMLEDIMDGG